MNAKRVRAAEGVIFAAQKTKLTAAGIAASLEAAGMLQSPESAAELEQLRTDAARYRIAWRRARTRALSTGSAADRYAARARELQEALQESVIATLTIQTQRDALRDRVAELETLVSRLGARAEQRHLVDPLDHVLEHLADERPAPRCTCARAWNLHSRDCALYTPGHELAARPAVDLDGAR